MSPSSSVCVASSLQSISSGSSRLLQSMTDHSALSSCRMSVEAPTISSSPQKARKSESLYSVSHVLKLGRLSASRGTELHHWRVENHTETHITDGQCSSCVHPTVKVIKVISFHFRDIADFRCQNKCFSISHPYATCKFGMITLEQISVFFCQHRVVKSLR